MTKEERELIAKIMVINDLKQYTMNLYDCLNNYIFNNAQLDKVIKHKQILFDELKEKGF